MLPISRSASETCLATDGFHIDAEKSRTALITQNDVKGIKFAEDLTLQNANCAICVQTTYKMNRIIEVHNYKSEHQERTKSIKHCICSTKSSECSYHLNNDRVQNGEVKHDSDLESLSKLSIVEDVLDQESVCSEENLICNTEVFKNEILNTTSSTSLTSPSSERHKGRDHIRQDNFLQWCRRKDEERRLEEERQALIKKIKKQQKQALLELERENFRRWLIEKKRLEKQERDRQLEEEEQRKKLRISAKEKRLQECRLHFELWLKRKQEKELEMKLERQLNLVCEEKDKQKRKEYSRQAYAVWRALAINRQKPVAFGNALKSSSSLTYINPQPWVPNIEIEPRSQSQ